jgi:hypothetical protein
MKKRIRLLIGGFSSAILLAFGSVGIAAAAECPTGSHEQGNNCKVTICHRTDSVKNPYTKPDVDVDSIGGGKDEGEGDHTTHTGPVATSETLAQGLKDSNQKWGDIIPPFGQYPGYNWTAEGQAVYNNGCNYITGGQGGGETPPPTPTPTTTTTGGQGGGTPATPVAATAQVVQAPQGGVGAGGGGAAVAYNTASLLGMGSSVAAATAGLVWLNRRREIGLS